MVELKWQYTKEQQRVMEKLDDVKEKYAKDVLRIIAGLPEKHHQILVLDAMRCDLQVAFESLHDIQSPLSKPRPSTVVDDGSD